MSYGYDEEIRVLKDPPGDGSYELTKEQRRRKEKGQSIYLRDRKTKPYTVRHGKIV